MSKILKAIETAAREPAVRSRIHDYTRKVLKLNKNQCAATASMILMEAGVLDRVRTWTADLAAALEAKGWLKQTGIDIPAGAIVFTEDANDNEAPDHVWTFLQWLDRDRRVALIYDNYSAGLTARNYGTAVSYQGKRLAKTPAAYYMIPPQQAAKPFNELEKGAIRDAFRVLYGHLDKIPAAHGQLNALRETFRQAGVAHANEKS